MALLIIQDQFPLSLEISLHLHRLDLDCFLFLHQPSRYCPHTKPVLQISDRSGTIVPERQYHLIYPSDPPYFSLSVRISGLSPPQFPQRSLDSSRTSRSSCSRQSFIACSAGNATNTKFSLIWPVLTAGWLNRILEKVAFGSKARGGLSDSRPRHLELE